MLLPGGLCREDGIVDREWALMPLDGHVELALWEAWHGARSKVGAVTRAIASAIALAGARENADDAAADLSVADRQFLLAQLARQLGASRFWLSADCTSCGKPFDVAVDLARLPVKTAGESYPFAEAKLAHRTVRLRAPTGRDQAAVEEIADEGQAVRTLVERLVERDAHAEPALSDDDLEAIDEALQAVAPEVATAVTSACPDCGADNATSFDVAELLLSSLRNPLEEVHDIAATYHWGEGEILALPRERRHQYPGADRSSSRHAWVSPRCKARRHGRSSPS